jgi:predicted transcriptional regulator
MLFTIEELEAAHDRYAQAQAAKARERCAGFVYQSRTPEQWESRAAFKTRKEKCESDRRVLLEVVRDFPDATITELVEASGRSKSWVRKHLKHAGIVLVESVRRKKVGQQS